MTARPPGPGVGAWLQVRSGGRAGMVFPLVAEAVTVGRDAECQLRLDPERDLHVSARHVGLRRQGDAWTAQDLGSRNGSLLNGSPLVGEVPLRHGDRIRLGAGGPVLVFLTGNRPPAPPGARWAHGRKRGLVLGALGLGAALALGLGAFIYADRAARRSWTGERARMQARLDSLQRQSQQAQAALRGQTSGLAAALESSRLEVEGLRRDLAGPGAARDGERTAQLRRRLNDASAALRRQEMAAGLDFASIQRANGHAVATIYVEDPDGRISAATAFAVRPDGVLFTNRHVVGGADGRQRPRRIAIQFSDSEQVWPARLLAVAEAADLAAIAVDSIVGRVPVVRGLDLRADTLPQDAPVALIGFPLGGQRPLELGGDRRIVRALLGAGSIRSVNDERIQLRGYSAAGASGTPIFDAAGDVVGVLFGGRQEDGRQMLYAVPATAVARLLAELPALSPR